MKNIFLCLLLAISLCGCATAIDYDKVGKFGDEVTRRQETIEGGRMTVAQVKHLLRVANDVSGDNRVYKLISKGD